MPSAVPAKIFVPLTAKDVIPPPYGPLVCCQEFCADVLNERIITRRDI